MNAMTVMRVLEELRFESNKYEDGIHIDIDGDVFSTQFIICGDTSWDVEPQNNLLILETSNGKEYISTDKISRITVL